MHLPIDRIVHDMPFVTPVVDQWWVQEIGEIFHHEGMI